MTQLEKMFELKDSISLLYEKEGRSISYIAKLFNIDKNRLSKQIKEWNMKKQRTLSPTFQKIANKYREIIISKLNQGYSIIEIASDLNMKYGQLNYIITYDKELSKKKEQYLLERESNSKKHENNLDKKREQDSKSLEDLPGENWKEILGFPNYFVSNKGRFKKFYPKNGVFKILTCTPNCRNGRLYIVLYKEDGERKNLMAARIVAHAFCEGYSEVNNTVDHKDRDVGNNDAINLEWVPQSINNKRAYKQGKNVAISGGKHGKFKEIVLNDEYHFKTIRAFARFLEVSETQAHRYIDKDCKFDGKIELIY